MNDAAAAAPTGAPAPAAAHLPPPEIPGLRALLAVVVAVVVVAALYLGREVLIPITLAVLLSFVLAPVVGLLRRLWIPRVPAVLLAVLLALGAILFVGGLIGTQLAGLAADAPRYVETVQRKVDAVRSFAFGRLSAVLEGIGQGGGTAAPAAAPPAAAGAAPASGAGLTRAAPAAAGTAAAPIPVEVHERAPSPLDLAGRLLAPVLHPLATTGIVLVVATFVLLQREDLRDRLIRLAGATDLHRTTTALDDAARRLSRYFLAQLGVNAAFGTLIGGGLFLIGVPSPLLWGILAALLRFVPYVGAWLGAALPVALAAAVDPGWSMVVWTAALFLAVDLATGHVVEPLVYGHSTGLSPVSVVVAAIFWGWIWGPVGLILSMPLTLCLVVLGRHVERLEFLDVLLGDRPALSPAEAFYQRMLAGDPDEALDQAEALLKERSLSAYCDEVALKGLQLAAADAARGVLPPDRLERVKEAAMGLVADLGERPDADPPPDARAAAAAEPAAPPGRERPAPAEAALPTPPTPASDAVPEAWRAPRAVLCIAGRGPLDEAAAAMLAQLLAKRGIGAAVVPHGAVARTRVNGLDVAGVRMVCVSYLEISGSPAHLRYLVRRLRQRMPGAPLLLGLWPAEAPVLTDRAAQAAIGATRYAASLRDAVAACVEEAEAAAAAPEAAAGAPEAERRAAA